MKLFLLSFLTVPLLAQTRVQVTADCVIAFNFNATGTSATFDNRQAGCETWTLQYQSTGFTVVSLAIQSAPGPVTAGTFVSYAGTIDTGINPNTSTTGATTTGHNGAITIPWIRVSATLTGTGTLNGVLYGLKAGPSPGGGSGSSGCPNPCPVVGTAANGAVPSGNPVQVAGSDGTDIRTLSTDATGKLNVNAAITPSGQQDVNLKQVGGANTVTGGVAGSQGVGGLAASGAAVAGSPVLVAGSDGTNARSLSTDATGKLNVNAAVTPGGTQNVQGSAAVAGAAGNPVTTGYRDDSGNVLADYGFPDQAAVTISAGTDAVMVTGVASTNTYVGHLSFSLDSAQTVTIRQGTGSTCGTNTAILYGPAPNVLTLALDFDSKGGLHTTIAARDLCVHLGGSATLGGGIVYGTH